MPPTRRRRGERRRVGRRWRRAHRRRPRQRARPPGIPPECVAFCEAAAIRDCPKIDNCEGWCSILFGGACEAEVATYLECSPSLLTVDCTVAYPDDWLGEQCITANDDILMCDDDFCGSMYIEGNGDGGCVADAQR